MKVQKTKGGFTLIELLVVITIIGILATGGVGVFTKQLQGARDTARSQDLKLLETGITQYFFDNMAYPTNVATSQALGLTAFQTAIGGYISKFPSPPRGPAKVCWSNGAIVSPGTAQSIATVTSNAATCQFRYGVATDSNNLPLSAFKLTVPFEKKENATTGPAQQDGGIIGGWQEVFGGEGGIGFNMLATVTYASTAPIAGTGATAIPLLLGVE